MHQRESVRPEVGASGPRVVASVGDLRISVVIPVFRSAAFVGDCVRAVLAQELPVDEVVLVDDCSDDDSIDIAVEMLDAAGVTHVVVRQEVNQGAGVARNTGLPSCTGDVVWFFDSDDLAAPEFTRTMVSAMVLHGAQIAACRTALVDIDGAPIGVLEPPASRESVSGKDFAGMMVDGTVKAYPGGHVFRREVLGEAPWDGRRAYEDMAATMRIALACRRVALIDEPVYRYRQRPDSVSKTVGESTLGLFEMGDDVAELITASNLGRRSRSAARVFTYREVLIPACHMAMRAHHAGVTDEATGDVVRRLLDGARSRVSMRDMLPLLMVGEVRSAVFALAMRVWPQAYSRVLRSR